MSVCVCVRERERVCESDGDRKRERARAREREIGNEFVCESERRRASDAVNDRTRKAHRQLATLPPAGRGNWITSVSTRTHYYYEYAQLKKNNTFPRTDLLLYYV